MKAFSITELTRIIRSQPVYDNTVFTDISIDTRTIKTGDCFFAIKGENYDGHDFLEQAFEKGAACAVVQKDHRITESSNRILAVENTRQALGRLAWEYRNYCGFNIVAITGSVGKTTTRNVIFHVLSQRYNVFQSPGNYNNDIGLPLTLLTAPPQDDIILAELGANHPGEIEYLSNIAKPDIALVTNTCPAHLQGFGSLDTVISEKLSIAAGLKSNGTMIINADCKPLLQSAQNEIPAFVTFAINSPADITADRIDLGKYSSSFVIDGAEIQIPMPGYGNVENTLAAWAVCKRLDIPINEFAKAVRTLPAVAARAHIFELGSVTVIDDCYNANPASMKNALEILDNLASTDSLSCGVSSPASEQSISASPTNIKVVFICGEMAELAEHAQKYHTELGDQIARSKVNCLLTVGTFAENTAKAAEKYAEHSLQAQSFKNTARLCENLQEFIADADIILVKGSRVNKLEAAVQVLKSMFSGKVSVQK